MWSVRGKEEEGEGECAADIVGVTGWWIGWRVGLQEVLEGRRNGLMMMVVVVVVVERWRAEVDA